jgi:hypothetical protein
MSYLIYRSQPILAFLLLPLVQYQYGGHNAVHSTALQAQVWLLLQRHSRCRGLHRQAVWLNKWFKRFPQAKVVDSNVEPAGCGQALWWIWPICKLPMLSVLAGSAAMEAAHQAAMDIVVKNIDVVSDGYSETCPLKRINPTQFKISGMTSYL